MTPSHPRLMPLLVGALLCACLGVAPIQISLGTLPAAAQDNERKFEEPYGGSLGAETPVCWEGKRVALVIGNNEYLGGERRGANKLTAAVGDAKLIHKSLLSAGFEAKDTELLLNANTDEMLKALENFYARSRGACVAFFYYAGHGYEYTEGNLLLPTDATCDRLRNSSILLDEVIQKLKLSGAQARIFVLDSCRTPPSICARSENPRSLDTKEMPSGTAILYSTSKNSSAKDGRENSIFSEELAREIVKTARIEDVFGRTAKNTRERSLSAYGEPQQPWFNSTLEGGALVLATHKQDCPAHQYKGASGCQDRCPGEGLAWSGEACVAVKPDPYGLELAPGKGGLMEFVGIPAGEFTMGSPKGEAGRGDDETQHPARVSAFWMGTTPVTQRQFETLMGRNPSDFDSCGDDCPVETVSWWDAILYANRLTEWHNDEKGTALSVCYRHDCKGTDSESCTYAEVIPGCTGYRLPTEAEWEYAARAGSDKARYGDLDEVAWHEGNSDGKTHAVGGKQANAWGLHDMLGNVWQWTWDRDGTYPTAAIPDYAGPKTGDGRVLRGGSCRGGSGFVRAAERNRASPGNRWNLLGFRLSRAVSP